MIRDFQAGFSYPFYGLRFLFMHASLLRLALVPWMINIVLFISALTTLYYTFDDLLALMIIKPDAWYWLIPYYLFATLFLIVMLILTTFFVCLVGNLLAAPFHEWMAEKTKKLLYGASEREPFSFSQVVSEAKRILSTQLKKIALILFLEAIALLFLLIPVIGVVISGCLTLFLLSFQFLDFPFGVEHLRFEELKKVMLSHPFACLGFGAGISLMLAIPILNLSVLPGGVVGASLLYYQHFLKKE